MPSSQWKNLRMFNGSQQGAFEELCCQLAFHEIPEDFKFTRKGAPDAGVECFATAPNGSEWGWQAKFFDKLGPVQWRELDQSFFTAINKHRKLVKYYVCIPIDLSDPRNDGKKSQLDRWEAIKNKWAEKAKELGKTIEIEYWGSFEIFQRLALEKHRGRIYFWFNKQVFSTDWLQKQLDLAIDAAGPRYTSALNIKLPIAKVFDGLGRTPEFINRIKLYVRDIKKSFTSLRLSDRDFYTDQEATVIANQAAEMFSLLGQVTYSAIEIFPWREIHEVNNKILIALETLEHKLWELDRLETEKKKSAEIESHNPVTYEQSPYREERHRVYKFSQEIGDLSDHVASEEISVSNHPFLLVVGDAGKGKTHLFCDVARNRLLRELPTLLLLGEWFSTPDEPWTQLLRLLDLRDTSVDEFLGALDAAAQARGQKALIMIDAINEGNGKQLWRSHLARFVTTLSKYSWLGLAVSVRSSYENVTIPTPAEDKELFIRIIHPGFADHEYDAVRSFFEYYGLELPAFPLLLPEFQTPLFLKILCKGLHDRGITKPPSGYVGITETFQLFIDAVDEKIWRENYSDLFHGPRKLVWRALEQLAEVLTVSRRDWLRIEEAEETVNKLVHVVTYRSLLSLLISEGVLSTHMHYEQNSEFEVIRFSYEKFSDHILANYLINKYIHSDSPRKPFSENGPLEYLIKEPWRYQGLIESLSIQIPEKLGKELPDIVENTSSADYLGKAFISSIIWRDIKAFSQETKKRLSQYSGKSRTLFEATTDALLTVATNPHHPYNARFLHSTLKKHPMAERDAWWSIYLHRNYGQHNALDRTIDWAWSDQAKDHVSDASLELCGITLTWFFTTSNRFLRDRATKALVSILTPRLHVLENILDLFKDIDDLYVIERLYASAYGCALRSTNDVAIKSLAETVYRLIFSNRPPVHVLSRDYARGVIEYAIKRGINLDIPVEKTIPPYKSEWPQIPSEEEIANYHKMAPYDSYDGKWSQGRIWFSVMDDDFARYIIGTNLSHKSRHWLSLRIDDNSWKTPKAKFEEFVASLSTEQLHAWRKYQAIRRNSIDAEAKIFRKLPDGTLRLLLTMGEGEDNKPDVEVEEQYAEIKERLEQATEKINAAADEVASILSEEQRQVFTGFIIPYENNHRSFEEFPRFNLDEMQRWILKRVFDLGWTVERFGKFDRLEIDSQGRDSHKAERIGKKYQWIAYHEFLAYLSDHYQFRDEYGGQLIPFEGAWQLDVRDIDPSCTVKSSKGNDARRSTLRPWWLPIEYNGWVLEESEENWLRNNEDLPDIKPLIEVAQTEIKINWFCLDGFYKWEQTVPIEEDKYQRPRREFWLMIRSYLVNSNDLHSLSRWATKQDFMGRWMPEPASLYEVFLGEFHWSKIYRAAFEDASEWVGGTKDSRVPKKILVPVDEYINEGSGFDCSTDHGLHIKVPSRFVALKMGLHWNGVEGKYFDKAGSLIAFDPSVFEAGPSVLLIRRDKFHEFLQANNLGILWTVIGEKQLIGGSWNPEDWKGRLNITGAYWLDGITLKGKTLGSFEGRTQES
jgi:hypothetical protein